MVLRRQRGIGGLIAASAFGLAIAASSTALADPKICIHSHSTGQREAKAGHLRLASQLFTSCGSDETCPDQLRKECIEFLQEVTRTIPTVVFSALDENGHDLASVRVYSSDELLADGIDGRAVEIDPGKYHLRFVIQGGDALFVDIVVREGEKQRLVQVKKEGPSPAAEHESATGADAYGDVTPPARRGAAPWIAAGVTAVALGAGVTLGVVGSGKKSDLEKCMPNCPASDHSTYDGAKSLFLGADISFAAAIVAGAVTTWLFLSSPSHDAASDTKTASASAGTSPAASPAVWFGAAPLPGGGSVGMAGRF
ncbi:MAG TPA: hypothetical protein VH044_19445 [Polyangiaceae bacterium]|nr:hypothetical protein [Polyangiaceae bacterium]